MDKASNNALIPSQKNLNAIITAYIENTDTIIKKLIKNASTYDNYKNVVKNIDNYHKIIDHIFSSKGILMSIIQLTSNIDAKKSAGTLNTIKIFIRNLSSLIDYISIQLAGIADIGSTLNFSIMETTYVKVIESLNTVLEIISKLKISIKLHFKLLLIRWQFNAVKNFIDDIGEIGVDMVEGILTSVSAFSKFKMIDLIVQSLNNLFSTIYSIKVNIIKLKFKLWRIKLGLKQVLKIVKIVDKTDINPKKIFSAVLAIGAITFIFTAINHVINTVKNIKVGLKFLWKLFMFKFALAKIISVANELKHIDKKSLNNKTIKSFFSIIILFSIIVYTLKVIRGAKVGPIVWLKLFMFQISLKLLAAVINEFKNIKYDKRSLLKVLKIKKFIKTTLSIFNLINVNLPLLILSIISFATLNLAIFTLAFTLGAIIGIINTLGAPIAAGLVSLMLIKSFVNKLVRTMLLLAVVSVPMLIFTIPILLFLGASALIIGALTLVGTLILTLSPMLVPAIAGFVAMGIMVGALIITALLLAAFAMIELDVNKIKENIEIVLDTTLMIIDTIFNRNIDNKEDDSKTGIFTPIISFVGNTFGPIIKSIAAIPFLITAIASICIITIIAAQLKIIQEISLNDAKIKENVNSVLSTVTLIGDYLMKLFPEKEDKRHVKQMKNVMRKVSRIVTHMKNIAEKTNFISTIEINSMAVNTNVNKIFEIIKNLEAQMISFNTGNAETSEETKKENLIDAIKNARKQKKLFKQNKKIVKRSDKILLEVNDIVEKLEYLSQFSITAEMQKNIQNNITGVFGFINHVEKLISDNNSNNSNKTDLNIASITQDIKQAKKEKKLLKQKTKVFNKTDKVLLEVLEMIDGLEFLGSEDCSIKKSEKLIKSNITAAINLLDYAHTTITTKFADNKNNKSLKGTTKSISSFVNSIIKFSNIGTVQSQNVTKVFGDFIDKVNTVEVSKLEKSAQMFQQMANFSNSIKGNFEKLAESINEDLMPVLEELKEIMEKVPTAIEMNGANVSAAVASTTVAPTTTNVTKQVERENPGMDKKQVEQLVQARLKEHATSAANSTASKIDELISLLKGYSGDHVVVQTI